MLEACSLAMQDPQHTVFVEFGAGKGYLSCMLAESFPDVGSLILVDRQGFRLTADRCHAHAMD